MSTAQLADGVSRLAHDLVALATARGVRIAVAESLTGGMLASSIVSVPGASRVLAGGVVAYDTVLKRTVLGVDADLLRERGPVDATVAQQMARGVRVVCAIPAEPEDGAAGVAGAPPQPVEIGISTTGVAGPDPDQQTGQPAGTVWIGISRGGAADEAISVAGLSGLDRQTVRERTVQAALKAAIRACAH